jgi:hypothetical protein
MAVITTHCVTATIEPTVSIIHGYSTIVILVGRIGSVLHPPTVTWFGSTSWKLDHPFRQSLVQFVMNVWIHIIIIIVVVIVG